MSFAWLLTVGQFVAEALANIFLEHNALYKLKEHEIKRNFRQKIDEALQETIASNSEASFVFENFDIQGFLSNPSVLRELSNIIDVESREELDLDTLTKEWGKHLGSLLNKNHELTVKKFISVSKDKLWGIKELQMLLHFKEQKEIYGFLKDISHGVNQLLSSYPSSSSPSAIEQGNPDRRYQEQLTAIKALINDGYPNAALVQLSRLEEDLESKNITNSLRAKISTLMGSCLINLEKTEEAIDRFVRAHELAPDAPETLTNLAIVSLIKNDLEYSVKLSEQVLEKPATGTTARAVWFDAQARLRNYKNLSEIVDEQLLDNKEYARVVGLSFTFGSDLENAEKYLRLSWAQSPGDYYTGLTLARVLMKKTVPVLGSFGSEFENNALLISATQEPLKIVNEVLEKVSKGDNKIKKLNVLATRAGLYIAQGNISEGKQDCDLVLREDNANLLALHNRAIIALIENDFLLTLSLFEKLPKDYIVEEKLVLAYARAYIGILKYDSAIELLNSSAVSERSDFVEWTVMKVWALVRKNEYQLAKNLRQELLMLYSDDYYCMEAVGHIDLLLGETENALLSFEKAYSLASEVISKQSIAVQIAHIHYRKKLFKDAVQWIELADIDFASEVNLAKIYVSALYSIGEYEKTLRVTSSLRNVNIHDSFLYDVETWIMEYLGDLSTALLLIREIAELNPKQLHHKFQIARLEFRLGNKDKATSELQSLNFVELDAIELIQVAEMYQLMGHNDKVIELAYIAYRRGRNSPEIHRSYFTIFLRLDKKVEFNRDIVADDTSVLLENDQGERWVTILSLVPADESREEYLTTSLQAKLLLGHKVGDVIEYKNTPLEKFNFEIKEIQSIYVRAFQDILNEYGFRFPDDNSIQKIQIKNNDLSDFMMMVARMSLQTDKVLDAYKTGGITVEQFSLLTGNDQFIVFRNLQMSSTDRIVASRGLAEEQVIQRTAASNATKITLTLSALITSCYLDALDLLSQRFNELYIHQQTIDLMDKTLYKLDNSLNLEKSTIGYHAGRFFMNEIPRSQILDDIQFVQKLRNFIAEKCKVVSIDPSYVQYLLSPISGNLAPVGEVSNASILIAKQTNTPIYSDEWILSHFALLNYGVSSFWSQSFFENLLNIGLITSHEYSDYCYGLLKAGYYFVSINSPLVYEILSHDGFHSSGRVEMFLQTLRGPDTREFDAVKIAAELIKRLWLGNATPEQRRLVLDRILQNIVHGRIMDRMLVRLQELLAHEFIVAPLHLDDVNQQILNWWRIHRRRGGLLWGYT